MTITQCLPGTVEDGMPHLCFYDRTDSLSFVWSGHLSDPIHVQHGGYGEPTIALVDAAAEYVTGHATPAEVFAWFENLCTDWIESWDGETGRVEVTR